MKKAADYRMLVYAERSPHTFPLVDFAQQVGDKWLSVSFAKTAEQLSEETQRAALLALRTTGSATYHGPIRLVSLAHGRRLCRAYDKAAR